MRLAILDGILKYTDDPSAREPDWGAFDPLRFVRIAADALVEIIKLHRAWFRSEKGGRRADLRGAYLRGAYLRGADLQGAYLRGADLQGADLQGADLQGADLRGADLRGADLRGAYLRGADLRGAYLQGAYLRGADLRGAYLQGADLQGADLQGADLQGADLQGADLQGAYLQGAYLQGAYLQGADLQGADLRGADLPAPTVVLLAFWGALAADLTVDLMRYDASCHPEPEAFDRWAQGGGCPYSGVKVERAALFEERRGLWSPGPASRPYDLMVRVLAEKCPEWGEEKRKAFEATFTAMRETKRFTTWSR